MIIGVVGDIHLKENLGYADYIADRRRPEKKEVLDFIHKTLDDCDTIVLMGDSLHAKNNPSNVIKDFVAFVKGFGEKEIYILAGNHEKFGDGRSAIDFMKEMKIPNWHIITNSIETIQTDDGDIVFCPYFHKSEVNKLDNLQASEGIVDWIENNVEGINPTHGALTDADIESVGETPVLTEQTMTDLYNETTNRREPESVSDIMRGGSTGSAFSAKDYLFVHHAISGTAVTNETTTDLFNEPVLDKDKLLRNFALVVGGHIHRPSDEGRVILTGSVFNNEAGEDGKKIWKIDTENGATESIDLPGRKIYSMKDPSMPELEKLKKKSIVKVVLTKKLDGGTDELRDYLKANFDAYLLLEQYPSERKKINFEEGMVEFTPEGLLKTYAKEREVPYDKLISAYELIKNE